MTSMHGVKLYLIVDRKEYGYLAYFLLIMTHV